MTAEKSTKILNVLITILLTIGVGLLGFLTDSMRTLSQSVSELNQNVATVVERQDWMRQSIHDNSLDIKKNESTQTKSIKELQTELRKFKEEYYRSSK